MQNSFYSCKILCYSFEKLSVVPTGTSVNPSQNPFRLNIGFIIKESVGYSRTFEFEQAKVELFSDLKVENLKGSAKIDRTQKGLVLQASFTADLPAECVRCLIDFKQPVITNFTELYAFDNSTTDENELLVPEEGYFSCQSQE